MPAWGRVAPSPFQAQAAATAVPRILVKLRPTLSDVIEAALPAQRMALSAGAAMPPELAAFMARYSARKLAPLYPDLVSAKKQRQVSAGQLAIEVRARYAKRANRLRANFAPPDLSRTYVMEIGGNRSDFNKALAALQSDPEVEYAEEDKIISVKLTPNDPYFSSSGSWGQAYYDLWGLHTINASLAWDASTGAGIVVAVVDTGIDYNHPDIGANVWMNKNEIAGNGTDDDGNGYIDDVRGWNFVANTNDPLDDNGHGTHVAGTIAAIGNNGLGIIGVAWQARVMALKALDSTGSGPDSILAPAILYAANNGADVINASWGSAGPSQTIADAVDYAYNMGAVFVAAAGNGNDNANNYYPANLWDVITVAASDPTDALASFSNWGDKIDVAAPGVDILSLRAAGTSMGAPLNDAYTRADGTSMAAPHVSGLAALILAAHPEYSNEEVRQAIRVSADNLGQPGFDMNFGYGRIDASAAVAVTGALEAKISGPTGSTTAQSAVTISGIARGTGFASYRLEYGLDPGPGLQPTAWTTLQTGTGPVSGTLGAFDPTAVLDGTYTIRLTAYNTAGQAFSDRIEVVADSVNISSPAPAPVLPAATTFKPGAGISILGTTAVTGFQSYQVEWARGVNPSSGWQTGGIALTNGGSVSVANGPLAIWNSPSGAQADYYTVRVTAKAANFTSVASTTVYLEPDLVSANWPQWLDTPPPPQCAIVPAKDSAGNLRLTFVGPEWGGSGSTLWSFSPDGAEHTTASLKAASYIEPAAGNLAGSSGDELIVANGPDIDVIDPEGTSDSLIYAGSDIDFTGQQVVLTDLDGDSHLEAVTVGINPSDLNAGANGSGYVFAWRSTGQQVSGSFPIEVPDKNFFLANVGGQRVLVGDIDGDGKEEIIVLEGTTEDTFTPRLFGPDGSPRQWSAPTLQGFIGMMALADLDHNGKLELVFSNLLDGNLHVLQSDGSERPGWPQQVWVSQFAIGDLNRDGHYEIVGWGAYAELYVLNADGTPYSPAFPWRIPTAANIYEGGPRVVLADINGDGSPEIITNYGIYFQGLSPAGTIALDSLPLRDAPVPEMSRMQIRTASIVKDPSAPERTAAYSGDSQFSGWSSALVAIDRSGNIVRSWNLTGANGLFPNVPAATVGDFNGDGLTEIAISYMVFTPHGATCSTCYGPMGGGIATVLATGAPYNPSANDWPMIYHDPRNTAVVQPSSSGPGSGSGSGSGSGACTLGVDSNGESFTAAGGTASVRVTAAAGCQWKASSDLYWVTISGSGPGSGSVIVRVSANTAWSQRTGQIVIAGKPFTLQQEGISFKGVNSIGSLAQIAFGGGWDTSITIMNLEPASFFNSSAAAELDFFANDGSTAAVPLTSPQQSFAGTMLSPMFGQSINAHSQAVLDVSSSSTASGNTAWAQLRASGPIGGFSIFKNNGQEAVVPLETRNAGSYLMAFDNTGQLATGLAVSNVSAGAAGADIRVVIRDDSGAELDTGHISLTPQGHNSFMLTDSTYGFPATAAKRGTVEFDTPSNGQISVLGLRANGAAITTLPVFAGTGTGGGTMAHIASGGGWQTLMTLVNTGASSAQAQLKFFDEQGNPMALPLAFPQTGATARESTVSQTLAAGASLLIQTQGTVGQTSQVGSAQLTTTGTVSGFAIFRNSGQEAVVPLASGRPSSQFLVFDNTNGLATGIALANSSGSQAAIPVTLRDDAGSSLASTTTNLPANGHTSAMLTDLFPAAANIRGSVEFDTPAGGQISALGIRATPAGAYTTIPVMTK